MTEIPPSNDPYLLHKLALSPLLPDTEQKIIERACKQLATIDEDSFLTFLRQQGLASLWAKMLEQYNDTTYLSGAFKEALHQARLHATRSYLIQQHRLKSIKDILDSASIAHVVYKGASFRERFYEEPALRPAVDIDVLVPERHKVDAIKSFKQHGFDFYGKLDNISHETNLVKGNTCIDLHWDILRPGRTRIPMSEILLNARQNCDSHWGLSDEGNLFIMLVHPVFAKYSTTPQASLIRTVDLAKILERKAWELASVIDLLDTAGLKTAAWITLQWFKLITQSTMADDVIKQLEPGQFRQRYLNWWLKQNLASRLLQTPAYVQVAFTLPAHDKLTDALRAVRRQRTVRRAAQVDLRWIEAQID
jgi:hypothetical protein